MMKQNNAQETQTQTTQTTARLTVVNDNGKGLLTQNKTATKTQNKKEEKPMMKTQNTTTQKPAPKTPEQIAREKKTPLYIAPQKDVDGTGKILCWKSAWTDDGQTKGVELKPVSMPVPRNVIPGKEDAFAKAVQHQLYRFQIAICREQIAKLKEICSPGNDKRRDLTDKESARLEGLEKQKALAEKKAKAISIPAEEKNNVFANTCARFLLNSPIGVECKDVVACLRKASGILNTKAEELCGSGKAELTPEQQNVLTMCKDAIRKALEPMTRESELTCQFKLSIGNKDLVSFYRLGFDGWNSKLEEIDIYSKETSKKLEVQLVRFFLRKVKIADADKFTGK